MAAPEVEPQIQQPQPESDIQQVPEQAEIRREVEEATGVQAVPAQPQPVQDDSGQTIAQPVPPPQSDQPSITIPAQNQQQLDDYTKSDPMDSKRWFGVYWIRQVKKALHDGFRVIFGQ